MSIYQNKRLRPERLTEIVMLSDEANHEVDFLVLGTGFAVRDSTNLSEIDTPIIGRESRLHDRLLSTLNLLNIFG